MNCGFCHLASGHRSVKESNQDGNNRLGEKVEIKREMYTLRRIVRDEIQMPEFHHNNKEPKSVSSTQSVPKK